MTDKKTEVPEAMEPPEGFIPAGFRAADTAVDNFEAWEFANGPLKGKVEKKKIVELIRRGEAVDVGMLVVITEDGEPCILWESANLADFFEKVSPGMTIWVERRGEQQLTGGRTMKLYNAYYR